MIQAVSMVRVNVGAADCGHSDANQDFIGLHIANRVLSKLQWSIRQIANSAIPNLDNFDFTGL